MKGIVVNNSPLYSIAPSDGRVRSWQYTPTVDPMTSKSSISIMASVSACDPCSSGLRICKVFPHSALDAQLLACREANDMRVNRSLLLGMAISQHLCDMIDGGFCDTGLLYRPPRVIFVGIMR